MKQIEWREGHYDDQWSEILGFLDSGEMICISFLGYNRYFFQHQETIFCLIYSAYKPPVFCQVTRENAYLIPGEPNLDLMREIFADAIMEELL